MSRDPKDRPTAVELMNELDALARMKTSSGRVLPAVPAAPDPKIPSALAQPAQSKGQPLQTRIGSGFKKLASLSREQVQMAMTRKSAAPGPVSDSARTLESKPSRKHSTPPPKLENNLPV